MFLVHTVFPANGASAPVATSGGATARFVSEPHFFTINTTFWFCKRKEGEKKKEGEGKR